MPSVWFVRHGQSQSNSGQQTLCPEFTGLTSQGIKQAECISQVFPRTPSLIVTSKYIRSKQTALPTIKRFHSAKQEQWDVREFTYLSRPHSSSMTVQDRRPMVDDFWDRNDPSYSDGDGAESFINFVSRVSGVLERLRYSEEDFIAVFTHGQFMQAVLWLLQCPQYRIDSDSMREFKDRLETICIPNGAILPVKLRGREEIWIEDIIVPDLLQLELNCL